MKAILAFALVFCLYAPAAAQSALKCPEFAPKPRSVKVSRMQSLRRGKEWLAGAAKSANSVSCDLYGMKIEEAGYDGKNLALKNTYIYKEKAEARDLCRKLKSEEKPVNTFSEEDRSTLDDYCRKYLKKDFGVVQVFDASPSQGGESSRKPVRQIFRLYGRTGFPSEERSFDPLLKLETVTLYAYDKAYNLTELTENDYEGRQLRRETYTWNKATNSRTHSVYGETNELRRKAVFELREDGTLRREVRSAYDSGEQPVSRSEIYCDGKGQPEKELLYDADAADPKYEYTYSHKLDAKGNWIEERRIRVIVYNGKRMQDGQYAPEITKREFQYY